MAAHNELGKWGEDIAADFLRKKGYVILERNWRSGHRDIDIVAKTGNTIVFVEVKTRKSDMLAEPSITVGYGKLRHLQIAINHYIKYHMIDDDIRIDIITVVGSPPVQPTIDHLEDIRIY